MKELTLKMKSVVLMFALAATTSFSSSPSNQSRILDNDPRDFDMDLNMPSFHIVPYPFKWSNDPNGPMYDPVHDKYHLFMQYDTPRLWGHVVSDDLINWKQLPVAISNDTWYDAGGVYSGSATILNDEYRTPVLSVSSR